jgi:hypothetical protein
MDKMSLCRRLGRAVKVPPDYKVMRLTEIYSNGNVACVPMVCANYDAELREYHGDSVKSIDYWPDIKNS